ncbi:hypothetical protein NFI96_023720 [Prochilodus magdalenae]|nr:hypothetical protein NFI96_023720 [Prochilodus magdalenae]
MFFDFSSAFSNIQPILLKDKLDCTGLDHHLTTWILNYLTNRPQYRNCLQISAGITKELVVDFRRAKHSPPVPVNIQGMDIEIVRSYKYLGVHLNKLDWTDNTAALYKKGQSRLHLLRRLRSFGVQGALLRTFFDAVVASAIFYGVVCWGSSISTADRKRLNKIIKKSSSVLGCHLDPVEVVGDRRMRTKFKHMLKNLSHPMYHSLEALGSSFSARLLHPRG